MIENLFLHNFYSQSHSGIFHHQLKSNSEHRRIMKIWNISEFKQEQTKLNSVLKNVFTTAYCVFL